MITYLTQIVARTGFRHFPPLLEEKNREYRCNQRTLPPPPRHIYSGVKQVYADFNPLTSERLSSNTRELVQHEFYSPWKVRADLGVHEPGRVQNTAERRGSPVARCAIWTSARERRAHIFRGKRSKKRHQRLHLLGSLDLLMSIQLFLSSLAILLLGVFWLFLLFVGFIVLMLSKGTHSRELWILAPK